MGVVYRARQVSLNRPVALKMIRAGVLADDEDLRRFQNEAEAVALLDHPGIVPVHEVGEHQGQRYFSMRLVAGGNLAERLAAFRNNPRAAAALVAEAAEAVHHAHMRGILHRDLKPANILVDPEGHPHITDFGLAKRVEADAELTASGAILGTPAYMAPEQVTARRGSITTATDVHGLGAVLYAMLVGRAPFGGDSVIDTLTMVRERPPDPPRKVNPKVPRDLEVICLKCLEKDPRRRYAGAQALADDLRRWLEDRPILARGVGPLERAGLWCKRRPAVAALAAAVVLAVVAGTSAVIAIQARANAELKASNLREKERFALAEAAIGIFHGEVSEDLLLKEKRFDGLRGKLLRGAAEFYGRLERLLEGQPDRDSRASLGRAYFELGKLTDKIGDRAAALAVLEKALAVRRALAAEPGAGPIATRDLARSLAVVGTLKSETGDSDGAMSSHREALAIRRELADAQPTNAEFQAELAASQSTIGALLGQTGKRLESIESQRHALIIWQKLAEADPTAVRWQIAIAACHDSIATSMFEIGRRTEALASCEEALAIRSRLLGRNPEAEADPGGAGIESLQYRCSLREGRSLERGPGVIPGGAGDLAEAGRGQAGGHGVPEIGGLNPDQHGHRALKSGAADRGVGVVSGGAGHPEKAGRGQSQGRGVVELPGDRLRDHGHGWRGRATRGGPWRTSARRWPSKRRWPMPTRLAPCSRCNWPTTISTWASVCGSWASRPRRCRHSGNP